MGSDEGLEASDDAEWWSRGGRSPSGDSMRRMTGGSRPRKGTSPCLIVSTRMKVKRHEKRR